MMSAIVPTVNSPHAPDSRKNTVSKNSNFNLFTRKTSKTLKYVKVGGKMMKKG